MFYDLLSNGACESKATEAWRAVVCPMGIGSERKRASAREINIGVISVNDLQEECHISTAAAVSEAETVGTCRAALCPT